jgi:antitoxin (DNA-binding transcriptional repressor) of toxin-antitoxin stability system
VSPVTSLQDPGSRQRTTVTGHDRPIARVVPVVRPTRPEQLRAEGRVRPATRRKRTAPQPVDASSTVRDLIADQRR